MTLALCTETNSSEFTVDTGASSQDQQKQRILAAIGSDDDHLPVVDEETLFRYYLFENLSLPFNAHYPELITLFEEAQYQCTVLELLSLMA